MIVNCYLQTMTHIWENITVATWIKLKFHEKVIVRHRSFSDLSVCSQSLIWLGNFSVLYQWEVQCIANNVPMNSWPTSYPYSKLCITLI